MTKEYCCEMMKENSQFTCNKCTDEYDCPDTLIHFDKSNNEFGIIIHDGGTSFIEISYCPWCGINLNNDK